ncbi:MAG: translation elongation factor Ts [Chloroflexi bacterium]|nr:translation elongation factor Ts [Chloroflexota bacterium]
MVTTAAVKELREQTGAGVMECKRALEEAGGNVQTAMELLRQRGLAKAERKMARVANQGVIDAYIHAGGRIGAMVEVNCETDFVARTEEFRRLAHNIAMQVAATNPRYVFPEELPEGADERPEEVVLLKQPYIREPSRTVEDVIRETIARVGENVRVRRFARFELGQ